MPRSVLDTRAKMVNEVDSIPAFLSFESIRVYQSRLVPLRITGNSKPLKKD